ncbi:pyridoxamine 5'-phosphate oxidase family protein [Phytohabitans kaempferiae]|uniref:Pyridoxamine 5'-phosphate oxidase family protein n=1 Tax=Phytohabitans kaempferiae TaxID=1620943 RepID=A0ABV6M5I6_9ACTN
MSIRFTPDEAWAFVERAHTGVLTTLRRDGYPVALPVWFVVVDRTVCFTTPPGSRKVARVRRDPRASFLVESGDAWAELAAVHLSGQLAEVTDEPTTALVDELFEAKYAPFRVPAERMPAAARAVYRERVTLRLVPDEKILSWDNSRIRLRGD